MSYIKFIEQSLLVYISFQDWGLSDAVLDEILQDIGANRKGFEENVIIIREWMKTQKHLPEILDDKRIRNFLLLNKNSIEITKSKIDMYYTLRSTILPNWAAVANPKLPINKKVAECMDFVLMPNFLFGKYRVLIFRINNVKDLMPVPAENISMHFLNMWEIRLSEDYMIGDYLVWDFKNFTMEYLAKFTPSVLKKGNLIYQGSFSMRLKKAFFINCPPYITTFSLLLKSVLKPKIFERIQFISEGSEVLPKFLPLDFLPQDFGGTGPTIQELKKFHQKACEKLQPRFDELDNLKVNEELRPVKLENDEMLGFYGNFKKLDVD